MLAFHGCSFTPAPPRTRMETQRYDKHATHAPGHGYEARKAAPTSIIVHSTSNPHQKLTMFSSEATFLLHAPLVSAHYLIGREGQVVRFLDPKMWAAWHAGNVRVDFTNQKSIGIELHHSVGDPPYPSAQLHALASLLRSLMALFNIPTQLIETHGQVAIAGPYQRKSDPSDWSHQDFLSFRSHLLIELPPPVEKPPPPRAFVARGIPVYQRSDRVGPLWGFLQSGETVVIDDPRNGHLADGRGFVKMDGGLEALP
jgi:hypothetical protein